MSTEFRQTGYPEVWAIPELDYVQTEAYAHWDDRGLLARFDKRIAKLQEFGKPIVLEEYGGGWWGGSQNMLAQNLHDGLWIAWMKGLPSTPFAWWWNLLFEKQLVRYHRAFAAYVRDESATGDGWQGEAAFVSGAPNLRALARHNADRAYVWVYDESVTEAFEPHPGRWPGAPRNGIGVRPAPTPLDAKFVSGAPDLFPARSAAVVDLAGMKDGEYAVEIWETWREQPPRLETARAESGHLLVTLPPITRDLALKIRRAHESTRGPSISR
jgi:hypothetical protein